MDSEVTPPDVFTYLGFWISRYNNRYYHTKIGGVEAIGTPEELTELIDNYLLSDGADFS